MRNIIIVCLLLAMSFSRAQEDKVVKAKDFKVTESVKKQRAMGYPMNVLETLPVVSGCEALVDNQVYLAKCMKDQFNFMFASALKGIEKEAKDPMGVDIYIEFIIQSDGTISAAERVKVSEKTLDKFVRTRFEQFRNKINNEKLIISPGMVYGKKVNTLYGVKFIKAFK